MIAELGSWASILGLLFSFFAGFGICKFTSKKNKQENKNFSLFNFGNTNQENKNSQ